MRAMRLVSLLGLSTQQSPSQTTSSRSWDTPFIVDNAMTSSREDLIPSATPLPSSSTSSVRPASPTDLGRSGTQSDAKQPGLEAKKMGVVGVLAGAAGVMFV